MRQIFSAFVVAALTSFSGSAQAASIVHSPSAQVRPMAGDIACTSMRVLGLGSGNVCSDSGYRVTNTFKFPNWGGTRFPNDALSGQVFVSLFGRENVCVTSAGDMCELTKSAKKEFDKMSTTLLNGRCEGIIVVNALVAAGVLPANMLQSGASSASALSPQSQALITQLNYWWATQFSSEVMNRTNDIRKQGLKNVVAQLSTHLKRGLFATLGIYSQSAGHAVLPIALTRDPSGVFNVIVYDSNLPGKLSRLQIDTAKDQWTYAHGTTSLQQPARPWTGKSGSIDLTPMSSRVKMGKCEFCGDKSPSGFKVSAPALAVPPASSVTSKLGG
jgi:hypothetical protein